MNIIGMPTAGRVTDAAIDWGVGVGAGMLADYVALLSARRLGTAGVFASALAAIAAGSVVTGTRGEVVATVIGMRAAQLPAVRRFTTQIPA